MIALMICAGLALTVIFLALAVGWVAWRGITFLWRVLG